MWATQRIALFFKHVLYCLLWLNYAVYFYECFAVHIYHTEPQGAKFSHLEGKRASMRARSPVGRSVCPQHQQWQLWGEEARARQRCR